MARALAGVRAYEELSADAPTGWRKIVVWQVSELAPALWARYEAGDAAGMLAHWVHVSIERAGWGPDGRKTPLGQHHSCSMALARQAGVDLFRTGPDGRLVAPTGDEARQAARAGHF